jgi:hypothetical protein
MRDRWNAGYAKQKNVTTAMGVANIVVQCSRDGGRVVRASSQIRISACVSPLRALPLSCGYAPQSFIVITAERAMTDKVRTVGTWA